MGSIAATGGARGTRRDGVGGAWHRVVCDLRDEGSIAAGRGRGDDGPPHDGGRRNGFSLHDFPRSGGLRHLPTRLRSHGAGLGDLLLAWRVVSRGYSRCPLPLSVDWHAGHSLRRCMVAGRVGVRVNLWLGRAGSPEAPSASMASRRPRWVNPARSRPRSRHLSTGSPARRCARPRTAGYAPRRSRSSRCFRTRLVEGLKASGWAPRAIARGRSAPLGVAAAPRTTGPEPSPEKALSVVASKLESGGGAGSS